MIVLWWSLLLLLQRFAHSIPLPLSKLNSHLAPFQNGCLVTFEVIPDSFVANALFKLKLTKTASVSSLNECAFVCYQNFCSAAIFEFAQPISRCHLQIGPGEICNHRLQRHYSFRNQQIAIISCIRCSPSKPVTISRDAELPGAGATTLASPIQPIFWPLSPRPRPIISTSSSPISISQIAFSPSPNPLPASLPTNPIEDISLTKRSEGGSKEEKESKKKDEIKAKKVNIEAEIIMKNEKGKKKEELERKEEMKNKKVGKELEKDKKKVEERKEKNGEKEEQFTKRNLQKLTADLLKQESEKWRIFLENKNGTKKREESGKREKGGKSTEKLAKETTPKKLFNAVFSLDLLAEEHSKKGWNIGGGEKNKELQNDTTKRPNKIEKTTTNEELTTRGEEDTTTLATGIERKVSTTTDEAIEVVTFEEADKSTETATKSEELNGITERIERKNLTQEKKEGEERKEEEENLEKRNLKLITLDLQKETAKGDGNEMKNVKNIEETTIDAIGTTKISKEKRREEENSAEIIAKIERKIKTKNLAERERKLDKKIQNEIKLDKEEDSREEKSKELFSMNFDEKQKEEKISRKKKHQEESERREKEELEGKKDKKKDASCNEKKKEESEEEEELTKRNLQLKTLDELKQNEKKLTESKLNKGNGKDEEEEANLNAKNEEKKRKDELGENTSEVKKKNEKEKKDEEKEEDEKKEKEENKDEEKKEEEIKEELEKEEEKKDDKEENEKKEENKEEEKKDEEKNNEEKKNEERNDEKKKDEKRNDEEKKEAERKKDNKNERKEEEKKKDKKKDEEEEHKKGELGKIEEEITTTELISHETTILDTTIASDGTERIPKESSTSTSINLDELNTERAITEEEKIEAIILATSNKEIDEKKSTKKPKDAHEEEDEKERKKTGIKEDEEIEKKSRKDEKKKKKIEKNLDVKELKNKEEEWIKKHGFLEDEGKQETSEEKKEDEKKAEESKKGRKIEDKSATELDESEEEKNDSNEEKIRPRRNRTNAAKTVALNGTEFPLVQRSIDSLAPAKKTDEVHPAAPPTIRLENGCFITFQAEALANRPANFTAPFELSLEVESIEICAVRCYQDGCTGALYHSHNKTCILGYEDKHFCSATPIISRFRHLTQLKGLNPIWIHCVNCRPEVNRLTGDLDKIDSNNKKRGHRPFQQPQSIFTTTQLPKSSTIVKSSISTALNRHQFSTESIAVTTQIPTTSPTTTLAKIILPISSSPSPSSSSSSSSSPIVSSSITQKTIIEANNVEKQQQSTTIPSTIIAPINIRIQSTISSSNSTNQPTKSIITSPLPPLPSISPIELRSGPNIPGTIKVDHGCFITFQAEPLAKRPSTHKAPFELKLDVESIEVCAIRCYQDGCTGALFHSNSRICELSYDDKHFCSNAPIISKFAHLAELRAINPLWIHCVNCRPEVNRKTGQLDNKKRE